MLGLIEYLNTPVGVATFLAGVFLIIQIIGELLEFKGKVVPEFIKIRKYFDRKKKEREASRKMVDVADDYAKTKAENSEMRSTIGQVKILLEDVKSHYNDDSIEKRNVWMQGVDNKFADIYSKQAERDELIISLNKKIDRNNADTLSLLIDNKRNFILDFAEKATDMNHIVSREQYHRFFKVYEEYENLIEENHMTNGEVSIAHRMTVESYEERLRKHAFFEDIHGYNA
jgi:hypothetical protein